jgi:hypothetical protein
MVAEFLQRSPQDPHIPHFLTPLFCNTLGVTACNFALKHVMSILFMYFSLCHVRGIILGNRIS